MLIVVLNDGETWTDVEGCLVLDVPDEIEPDEVKAIAAQPGRSLVAQLCDVRGQLGVVFGAEPVDDPTGSDQRGDSR